jgi:hypothetical protein
MLIQPAGFGVIQFYEYIFKHLNFAVRPDDNSTHPSAAESKENTWAVRSRAKLLQ